MSDLPKGWEATMLNELLISLESGSRPKGGVRGIKKGTPSIGGEHLKYDGTFDFSSLKYVPEEFANAMTKGHIQTADILIVKDGATTGKTSFVDGSFPFKEAFVNEHVFICRPSKLIEPRFLFRFLMSKDGQDRILENFQGSAQGGINLSFASNTEIPLAPLNEQRRIVAKLEKLLHRVDTCKERLEKIPAILKRFRQSVLAAACSGRLTADWREKNPDVAPKCYSERSEESRFRSNDETRFAQGDNDEDQLPESWIVTALENLCEGFQYGTSAKSQKSGKVPVLRMGNIQNGKIDWTDLAYTSDEDEINKFILRKGAVLFNRTNSPELVGKTGIYKGERPAIFAGYLIRIKNYPDLNSEYLNYCLSTVYAREFCQQVKTDGVSQSNVNAQKLGKFPLPLPPLPDQHEIIRRVEGRFKTTASLRGW